VIVESKISIPGEILPADGRFGSGPTKVRPEAIDALASWPALGTSHRQPPIKEIVRRIRVDLAELLDAPDGYEVALGNGGATAFWDMAAFSLIERRSQHLKFGAFSSRFASVVSSAPHLDAPEVIESEPGTHPQSKSSDDVDLYALTHNETSTGVAMEIRRPGPGIVAVDGTSAAGAIEFDPAEMDVYYFSPQKAFGTDGGLWVALLSPAAIERIEQIAAGSRYIPTFLSLHAAVANSRLNQTLNTPSLVTLFLLERQIEWIVSNGGLEWSARRCRSMSTMLYEWAERREYATPFVTDPAMRSPVTVTVDLTVDAAAVSKALRDNGIVDTESYRKLGRNQLRIGVWPATDEEDVHRLTTCIDYVVERL
jgi:phosphoserine aminotransferase